jgi:hypothetical protein
MNARWLDHDHIEAPLPAYDDKGTLGDGIAVIDESHPSFAEWAAFLESSGFSRPARVVR